MRVHCEVDKNACSDSLTYDINSFCTHILRVRLYLLADLVESLRRESAKLSLERKRLRLRKLTCGAKAQSYVQVSHTVRYRTCQLLSRPAIEEQLFKAFRRPRKEYMEDMWDAGHLCKILLKAGERFLPGPVDETRLA